MNSLKRTVGDYDKETSYDLLGSKMYTSLTSNGCCHLDDTPVKTSSGKKWSPSLCGCLRSKPLASSSPRCSRDVWGCLVVLGSFITHLIIGGLERSSGIIYLKLVEEFGRSAVDTAWAVSLSSTAKLLLGPLATILCNRFSCRIVAISGGIILAVGFLITSNVNNIEYLYVSFGLIGGVGRSFVYTPSVVIVTMYFNHAKGTAYGVASAGSGLGMLIVPPILQLLFTKHDFYISMLVLMAVALFLCVGGSLYQTPSPLTQDKMCLRTSPESDRLSGNGDPEDQDKYSPTPYHDIIEPSTPSTVLSIDTTEMTTTTSNLTTMTTTATNCNTTATSPMSSPTVGSLLKEPQQDVNENLQNDRQLLDMERSLETDTRFCQKMSHLLCCCSSSSSSSSCCNTRRQLHHQHHHLHNHHHSLSHHPNHHNHNSHQQQKQQKQHKRRSKLKLKSKTKSKTRSKSITADDCQCCNCITNRSKNSKRKTLIDLTLMKDPMFLIFATSLCLFTLGSQSSAVFVPALGKEKGLDNIKAAYLISILGVTDTVAKISAGFLLDRKPLQKYRRFLYNLNVFLISILIILCPFMENFTGFGVLCALYGIFNGINVSQKAIMLSEILGEENISSSFGLTICFQGLGALSGPPLSGLLKDTYQSYNEPFYFIASVVIAGACIMAAGNVYHSCRLAKRDREEDTIPATADIETALPHTAHSDGDDDDDDDEDDEDEDDDEVGDEEIVVDLDDDNNDTNVHNDDDDDDDDDDNDDVHGNDDEDDDDDDDATSAAIDCISDTEDNSVKTQHI